MSINASYLVPITARVISGGSSDLETNGCLLTKSAALPSDQPAMSFGSLTEVKSIFAPESDEYLFAQQYFAGLTNAQKTPTALIIGRHIAEDAAAWVRGAAISATLADFKGVSAGALALTVNGSKIEADGIDLSAAVSLSDVIEKVAEKIDGVTGSYDSNLGAFTLTTNAVGADATITVADDSDLATMLGLTDAAGAVVSPGAAARTESATLDAICAVTANWSHFTTLWMVEDEDEAAAFAKWADGTYKEFAYIFWSNDSRMTNTLTQAKTIPAKLNGVYECTMCVYAPSYLTAAFVLAYPATIKWDAEQGMKVIFGKSASGIPASVVSETAARALDNLKVSYVGLFATRNAEFSFANRGQLTGTTFRWIDTLIGSIWFRAKLQRAIMDGFAAVNRCPYNQRGMTMISSWCTDPIMAAKTVGAMDNSLDLSESQKSQILQETGSDSVLSDLSTVGYWLSITAPAANVRTERGTPVMALYYTYAGSVQRAELPVTAVV